MKKPGRKDPAIDHLLYGMVQIDDERKEAYLAGQKLSTVQL